MSAAPSHSRASHFFPNGTTITVDVLWSRGVSAESEPRDERTLLLCYKVRDRDYPGYSYDFDQKAFKLRRAGSSSELQGLNNVVAWLEDKDWSEEGYENFPTNFLNVFNRMVIDAVTMAWPRTYTILVRALIYVGFEVVEESELGPASEAAVAALEKVFVADGEARSCPICLEELPFKVEALSMPCSHLFHQGCIVEWLTRRSTCPMCRFQLNMSKIV